MRLPAQVWILGTLRRIAKALELTAQVQSARMDLEHPGWKKPKVARASAVQISRPTTADWNKAARRRAGEDPNG